jgi:outer membrane protein
MRSLLGLFVALLLSVPLLAQAEMRIGFVNAERVMRESQPAARALKKLDKEFERRDQELQKLAKTLQSMQSSLEKADASMPDAERKAKERDFSDMSRDYQRKERTLREDYAQRQHEELSGIQEQANRAIQQIAEKEKYDLILQEAVYANPGIDITDKVIKALADTK